MSTTSREEQGMSTTDKLTDNQKWSLAGRAPYKFHPQASHVLPDYRDGWNHALDAVEKYAAPAVEVTADAVEVAAEFIYGTFDGSKSHPWVERGNSLKQGDARDIARQLVAKTFPALVQQVERLKTDLAHWVLKCSTMSAENASKQAQIDALMLEYCPDEMTPEQVENWGNRQRRASPEQEAAINAALGLDAATAQAPKE